MERAVSAAEANRKFSKLLGTVREGQSYIMTAQGKAVAKIVPVARNGGVARTARRILLKRLRSERVVTIDRWTRDELYGDDR